MPNPKVKQIYDTLKEGGADVGSEKEFNDYFFAKGKDGYNNRKAIFDTLKEGGADAGDTYEDFAGWLGLHAVRPEETDKSAASATSGTTPISSSNRQTTRKGTSMTDAEKASMISNVGGIVRNSQAGLQRSNNMITYAKKKTGLRIAPVSIGHNPNVVETVKQYNPRTGKIQARYLTETGNEYDDKVQAGIEQTAIDEQKRRELDPVQSQLEDAYSERERLEKAVSARRKELEDDYKSKPWYQRALMEMGKAAHSDLDPAATAADSEHMGFEQDKQYMQLMAAIRKNHQTIQTLEDKKNGQMNSFWHSLGTALTNGYTFADGLPELRDATAMLNAQKHIDSINRKRQTGQTLTKEEEAAEAVLHNTQTDNAIQGAYGSEYGAWGRAGSGMAQSIDFMKDFLLLPGAGSIAKGVAGKVAKVGGSFLAKKAGESAVKATAKAIARATLKATGVVAGAHTAGAVISNTTGIGRTAAKMGQLSAGDVSMDENGNYKIENQQDLMSAFVEAEREQAGENGSEMFGEFIPGGKVLSAVSKKALSKIGLGRISDMLTSIGNKAWYKNYTTLLSKGGYNGIPGEALEEYEGMFFDAITGHADEAIQELTDPKQQVDIWLGCATMGALMGAIPMGLHVQGYYRYKHGMNRADKTADFRLTPEKWQPLKEQIDQTDNGNMSEFVVDNILNNNNLETQEKEAALDYVRNLTKFRGFNIAQVNNADEAARETQAAGVDPQNEERRQHDEYRQEAYEMGRNAASVVEAEGDRSDADAIVLRQREAYDEIERVFADDAEMRLAQLEDDPWEVMNDQSLTPEQQDAVAYFVNSKAAMDGLNDAVIENSENKGDEVARQIEKRTNKQSGMIHPATLKADDKQVYIVSGSVSMFADGSAVDIQNSSESIVVCDAETGELKFISPEQIYKVDAPVDPSVELKAADETIKAERQAIWGDTEETPEQVDSDQSQQQDVADEETNYEEQNESEENIPQSEPVLQDNIDSEVNLPHNEADTHEVSALSRIPKGEQGEPLLEQTDPETAWDGVVEYMENADDAQEYVESMVTKLAKDVDNATKAVSKIKPTGDIAQFKADKAAARQVQADAEARLEQWKQIANVNTERTKAEKAVEQEQRAVREAEIHQQAVKAEELRQHEELQKQAEQDARGANNVAHAIREKWDIAPKIDGAPNEIVLPNGERVNGHYVLTESGAVSPSHNATAEFVKTEGFPIDENGQSVNDRDYERDKDAQNVTRDIARNYDSRAMQSPVVVSKDGVVLSGNGRTMAGELAAANNTDGAYIEHLQKYPQQFGFTPEQVQGMQHPRVVFVPDADMPYNAETFAKFNQQEMKAQSKTEQAVKLGKIVDDATLAHITRAINSYETLGEFYADHKATRAAIRELQAAGVLSQAQIAEMFDGEGISAQGKEVLENMLIGKAFESNPDAIREITEFKSVRQSVITALAEIINNKSLGDDYSLEHELSQAVDLVYKARKANHKAGDRVSSYARQQNLFTFDEGDTVADYTNSVMLMLADVLNDSRSTRLKKILAVYNDKAAYSAVGQTDMFADGGIQNKEQIWNDVKQLIDYGTETEQQQAISEATERRKESVREDESISRSDERSGEIADVKLSDEVDEDGSPFIETSHGSTIFGEIKKESGLTPAPIKLSLGNSKYGLIHIEKRHGDQIRNAGFISVEEFVEFVCKNYKQIKQGENSLGENNGTYLIQIEDEHNNTLYVELSTDNKYWSVNSGGVFRKGYGKNKKEVWSASEVQSKQSATNSTLREEELSDKPTTPNGNVPTTSMGKDSQTSDTKQEKEDKFTPSAKKEGENIIDYATRVAEENDAYKARKAEEAKVNTSPTNAQKEAGNYKKGHIRVDGLDFTIEQPKGSIRRGKDANGKKWESQMHNTYGYIRGTEGVDGDHIDIFLSDNPAEGNVFVIDQVNNDGSFDEHKVMYGFPDWESAKQAYLSNYEDGWQGLGNITEVSKEDFKKWVDSSTRKTKPFAEYKSIKVEEKKSSKDLYNKEKEVSLQSNSSENENSRRDSQGTGRNRPEKLGENDAIGLRLESAGRESEKTTGGSLIQRVDREQVEAERLASEYGALLTIDDLFSLGNIGPSGTESDTYFSPDGYVYKMNNLMHNPLISDYLKRLSLHNKIFTNTPYELVGFVKSGRSIYPVVRQAAVDFDRLATDEEIISYMQSLGFTPDGNGKFHNNEYTVEDVKPKNVFMGKDRQVYVIDAEIFVKNELDTERTRSDEKNGRKIQGFEDYSEEEIIDALKGDVEMILEDSGIDDVEIKDVAIHGSRARGTAREDSDLDVVVEYSGDWKEDSLFNVLHEDEHTFEGIKVDFNPIREEESGSMQNYMKRSAAYDKDQLEKVAVAHISEEIMHDDIPAMTEEEYLASKGLASPMTDYTLDKTRIPHGETARQEAKRKREAEKVIEEYAAQKETARKEYRKKIANGELREPTKEEAEQKRIDALIKTANGHEDNPSVQAARRVLAKRGIEWKKNEDAFARAEQIAQDAANLKEMETYRKHTDTSGRTAMDEDKFDSENLYAPLTLDGKPSKLAVMTVLSDKITDPTGQIAVYDYSDEIDEKTNDGWQKWGDLADEYNKTADTNNKAHERGDEASLGFASVDAAVKFNDWLKERDNGNDTVTPESTVKSKGKASDFADGTTVAGKVVAQTKESVTIEQNGRRYDIRAKDLIEQSDKLIAAPKREYQKGNHVSANTTTKRRLATDAVLSLLDKAGVPVEIVSDETVKKIIPENAEKRIVYHGSSAKFEHFDHSHMGEGEGAQAYGWGSYVTEVEGIGRSYAVGNGKIKFRGFVLESMHSLEVKEHFSEAERKVLNFLYKWVKRSDNVSTAIEKAREWASNEYGKYSGRRDWSDQNYKDYFGAISKRDVSEWRKEMKEKEENAQQMLSFIETVSVDDFSLPQRHLYTVDIPDDTGSNYLSWEQPMTVEQLNAIEAYLKENFRANRVQVFTDGITKSTASNSEEVDAFTRRGENIYHLLEHILYDDKSVSEMLHSLGYTGISYPAEHQSGGREDGARNYVVFNEKDLKITNHVQFMKTPQGTVYGWTVGGKIYLTKAGLNPETPIHEYTHIWANAMRVHNAEGWNSIKELLKDTPVWAQVLNDPNYRDIKDDEDDVASEVLSRISGKENGKKFEEQANHLLEQTHGILEKARVTTLINNVRRALNKFWSWIGKNLFAIEKFGSIDEVTNRVLYDLVNGTDLRGAGSEQRQFHMESAEKRDIAERAKADGTYMKAPNSMPTKLTERQWVQVRTRAFKEWFGDWEKAARIEKLRKSNPIVITSTDYDGKYELTRNSAKQWAKDNIRGEYTILDTGERVTVSKVGINEVLSHGERDLAHLKSISSIERILENAVFITELPNTKDNAKYDVYRYYVEGVRIDEEDYTAKIVIGVKNGKTYYDHRLTQIEKGSLLDRLNGLSNSVADEQQTSFIGKDMKLSSILQTNSSKILDENGEPLVVDGLFLNISSEKPIDDINKAISTAQTYVDRIKEIEKESGTKYPSMDFIYTKEGGDLIEDLVRMPDHIDILVENMMRGVTPQITVAYRYGRINDRMRSYNYRDQFIENGVSVVGRVADMNTVKSGYYSAFYDDEPYTVVIGAFNRDYGSDGEMLLTPAYVVAEAENIKMVAKSATENNGLFDPNNDDIRYRKDNKNTFAEDKQSRNEDNRQRDFDEEVNEQFNRELAELTEKNAQSKRLKLGQPSPMLSAAGVPDKPIILYGNKLLKKAKLHNFDVKELHNLPLAMQNPIAVFEGSHPNSFATLLEIKLGGYNTLASIEVNKKGEADFNIISSLFGKESKGVTKWILDGKLLSVDKEKAQSYISVSALNADATYKNELSSAANIVKDFVNPSIRGEKSSLQGKIAPQDTTPQAKALQAKVLSEKLNTPIRVVSDPGVIAELPSRRQQRAKGWWSTKNDEVVILLPNNTDAADVANTAVHEVVGHKGLRKLIGEERFGEFLDEVHGHASKRVRAAIDQIERKLFDAEVDRLTQQKNAEPARPESRKGFFSRAEATVEANEKRVQMRREATEEYMADMAGRIGDDGFENMSAEELTFWGKVKVKVQQFLDKFLRGLKIAKGIKLTDKDVAYILYKSWKNMRNGGKPTIVDMAEDAMMRNKTHYNEADLVRFRDGNSVEYNKALARDLYEQRIKRGLYQTQEAIQDSMLSLKEAMRAILKAEGSNIDKIEDVADYENPYLGENRLSSVNQAECSAFAQTLFKPMLEEVARLTNNATERSELIDYMMAKHGLERNDVMAMRFANNMTNEKYSKQLNEAERAVAADPLDQDAKDALDDLKQRIQDYRDILYAENRGVDYAGLTALTGMDNVTDAENEANKMVSEYEANHDTTNLWAMINAVTKATLQKTYESGIISKAVYDDISNMYKNYIPLRGFDETTSEEAYAYLSDTNGAFNAPIKTAKGRTSKADDPFANMEAMAESAIMQGNRNILVKRKFMRFAQNHPSDLVSINDLWLRYDDVSGEWRPVNTGDIKGTEFIEENDTPADVERKMRDFETAIQQLSITDPDHFKRQKDNLNIPYRVVGDRDLRQHQVLIKQGGKDYVLTINGNPRVAQALNGLTNPDNDTSGALGAILHLSEAINRQLSAFYTTRNPDFIVSNFMRDMLYANTMVWVKESPNYALNFHKNFAKLNPVMMKSLLTKLRNGTLDMNNETEKAFSLFIANGGETGYANIRDIEQRKNDIKRELRKHNGKLPIAKALSILGERFDEYNRAVENCARFAAFITSYKMKRSIGRCVYDAKEISVNFNKKGSSAKFMGKTGQSKSGNVAAFVSGFGRSSYVFWNAAIQGTTNFGRQFKRHPEKAIAGAAVMFLLGAIVAWLEGDSDDKDGNNNYYDLPEYTRRSNIIFRIPGMDSWISIPLPVEYRALYGMGELMAGVIGDKEHYTTGELSSQIAGQVSQALPIDFMEGGGGFKAFVPSSIKPYAEVLTNKSWTGMPIYKKTPWNKDMPEWTKAYKSANKQLVGFFKLLNEISGGDPYTSGVIDINPAQAEYLLNGYFGGVSSTIDKFAKMGETALGQREYDPRSFLILNRLVKSGDERTGYRHINNEYSRLEQEHDKLKARLKHYEEDTYNGVFDYAEKINWINKSPEYQRLLIFEKYSSDINAINKELKETIDEESRKKLEALNYQLKQAMVDEANKTRK